MPTTKKLTQDEMIARHEDQGYEPFEGKSDAEIERVSGRPSAETPPTSVRLSKPLIERLDRIARADHRTRSNLIQHILWAYVHERAE